jgi:hypothetical protein
MGLYSRIDFSLNVANFVPNFVVKFILKFTNWIVTKASDWTPVAETGGGGRSPPLPIILAAYSASILEEISFLKEI